MTSPDGYGTVVWSSPQWQESAIGWLDAELASRGIVRTGPAEHPHIRPWATAIRVPTSAGVLWLKATGPGTGFEVALYPVLARLVPDQVLNPIAFDLARRWIVLPDGGLSIGEQLAGGPLARALTSAIVQYGRLQVELIGHEAELLAAGVSDMRPPEMPERFEQVLAVCGTAVAHSGVAGDQAKYSAVQQLRPEVSRWCDELAASGIRPSLDHNDLHPWNILSAAAVAGTTSAPADTFRFYDWGDSVLAHPFAAMLVPLAFVQRLLGVGLDHPQFLAARDAYLRVFSELAPGEDLARTLQTACRVAKIARVLTWERALAAAREQGDDLPEDYQRAPLETLFALLDDSYLGGA